MTILVVARNTFREATRDRVLVGALCAGCALLGVTQLLSPLALGEGYRLTTDLGLTGISLLGLLIVVMVGASLVGKEIEKRTIYSLLSRPIARYEYLIGKWAGLAATLWVLALGLGFALCGAMALRGHAANSPAILEAVFLAGLELNVVTALAVLFSAISTPVLSALYTVALYVVGQWSYDLRAFAAKFPPFLAHTCDLAANLAPNLPVFNMRSLAAAGHTTSLVHLGVAVAYAFVYCACVLCLAAAALERRDFK
jgi:ABC-type transport system involved in multi-copper enzyme maturation permease subunit